MIGDKILGHHISQQPKSKLEEICIHVLAMGGLVEGNTIPGEM